MTITIIVSNGNKEVKQVINSPLPINEKIANDIADDIYGSQEKKVIVR